MSSENRVIASLERLTADLHALRRQSALVGGLAVSARAEPRFTRDVDLVVGVQNDHDAEALVRDLRARGYGLLAVLNQDAVARLATVRLSIPKEGERGVVGDLLFASSGVESEIVEAAESLELVPGMHVRVARTGHLIALKLLARDDRVRPQDSVDLMALLNVADVAERELARSAVALIVARGFARGRDLTRMLDEALAR